MRITVSAYDRINLVFNLFGSANSRLIDGIIIRNPRNEIIKVIS